MAIPSERFDPFHQLQAKMSGAGQFRNVAAGVAPASTPGRDPRRFPWPFRSCGPRGRRWSPLAH